MSDRPLSSTDIPACLALSRAAGWNQTEHDWRLILEAGRVRGHFDASDLVATTAVMPYGDLGWICMVLVARHARRKGHATRLIEWALDESAAAGRVVGLDATPAGREVYRRFGLRAAGSLSRLWADAPRRGAQAPGAPATRRLREGDLPAVAALDAGQLGADRRVVLADLHRRRPELGVVAESEDRVTGFALGRAGALATQIGPVVARDAAAARALLTAALETVDGPVIIDVVETQETTCDWLRSLGFVRERRFERMLSARTGVGRIGKWSVAIAGPELA